MIQLHKKELQEIKRNLTSASWHIYGIERGVGISCMLKYLEQNPSEGFIAIYQDMGLCTDLEGLVKELYDICIRKELLILVDKEPNFNLLGLRSIFEQLVVSNNVIWILDHLDELFSKKRSKDFNRDFFNALNALTRVDGVRLLIVTRKPLRDEEYYDIESRTYKDSPLDLPSKSIPRLKRLEAEELLYHHTSNKEQFEAIKQIFSQFDQINRQGYLPLDIIILCDLIVNRLNRGIKIDKKECKAIRKEFLRKRPPKGPAIRRIGRIMDRIDRWVKVLVPFRIPWEKLLALFKKS
ncbi:TPA: hypothetical protein DCX16_06660 [bacterium]|nr:hypothetical protein [bacterium]